MVERFHDIDVRSSLIEVSIILPLTCIVFYIFETNMLVFGLFGYAGLVWIIRDVPNYKLAMIMAGVGGLIGYLSEYWGCSSHLWNWVTPCKTIWMIHGPEIGFPVEVIIAYAGIGFWISKLSLKMLAKEHSESIISYRNKNIDQNKQMKIRMVLILFFTGIIVILIEPIYLQSVTILVLGLSTFLFLIRSAQKAVAVFTIIVGFIGFFFENYATGIIPGFVVWRYNFDSYSGLSIPNPIIGVAPLSAFIAYAGVGMLLFGLSFYLNPMMISDNNDQEIES